MDVVAVNLAEERGRDPTRTNELKAVNQATTEAPHLKAETKAEEIRPNEREAAISHISKIDSKRHSSMVGALSTRTIR